MKNLISTLLLCLLSAVAPFAAAEQAKPPASARSDLTPNSDLAPLLVKNVALKQLINGRKAMDLRGIESSDTVTLGERPDELITHAILHLNYTFSPALIPAESHLKILVNDQIVYVLPVTKDNVGHNMSQDIEIDPHLFTDLTSIKFQFIGHYTHDCEDPYQSSLWMEIAGTSQFELTVRPLTLSNDLALLPEPYFDAHDFISQVKIPFVFSSTPGKDTLTAAGIVSSWFGKLAAWRGARFPARLDTLLPGNAIVFASNESRPGFLSNYPKITGPALEMMTSPVDGHSKLLLILGRNGADQKIAAQALVLGNAALAGSHVAINNLKTEPPRAAYDAPNWVRMDRPMKFGELVKSPQDLQVEGFSPPLIRIPLRIPPDLFTWRSRGVPIDLKYRYTPPLNLSESRLRMSVNDQLVKSFTLLPSGKIEPRRIRLPLLDDLLFGQAQEFLLPSFKLGTRNEMQFQFTTAVQKEGLCRGYFTENVRDMIDADSEIDFSGFPHYAEMPNLNHFATAGFPFTKYADLSQTVVVMPAQPNPYDIETMLTVMGRMGESTGYPATHFRIANPDESASFKNVDLLLIGTSLKQGLLSQWADKLPISVRDGSLQDSQPKRNSNFLYDWLAPRTQSDADVATREQIDQNGSVAAILGFESPLTAKRSVVAIISSQPQDITRTLDALDHSSNYIQGSAVFIHPNKVQGFMVGSTYHIGNLPFWTSVWYPFQNHPVLLAIMAMIAVLVFAFALWRTLRLLAAKRISDED